MTTFRAITDGYETRRCSRSHPLPLQPFDFVDENGSPSTKLYLGGPFPCAFRGLGDVDGLALDGIRYRRLHISRRNVRPVGASGSGVAVRSRAGATTGLGAGAPLGFVGAAMAGVGRAASVRGAASIPAVGAGAAGATTSATTAGVGSSAVVRADGADAGGATAVGGEGAGARAISLALGDGTVASAGSGRGPRWPRSAMRTTIASRPSAAAPRIRRRLDGGTFAGALVAEAVTSSATSSTLAAATSGAVVGSGSGVGSGEAREWRAWWEAVR